MEIGLIKGHYNVGSCSKSEINELRKKLISYLERIRSLNGRIQAGEANPRSSNGKFKKLSGNKRLPSSMPFGSSTTGTYTEEQIVIVSEIKRKMDPKPAMVELLTMLFEACGAKYCIEGEQLYETNVDDVVVALVNLACTLTFEALHNSYCDAGINHPN